jgi:tetratricopeptide (TPR) repeat protein
MYNESLDAYNRSLRMDPSSKVSWLGKGEVLFRMERYTEALAAFQKVIKLDPSEEAAYFWMGNSQLRSGDFQGAIASYEKALAINPKFSEAEQNRTLARQELARAEATPTPTQVLTIPPPAEEVSRTIVTATPDTGAPTPVPTSTQMPFLYSGAMGSIACAFSFLAAVIVRRKG